MTNTGVNKDNSGMQNEKNGNINQILSVRNLSKIHSMQSDQSNSDAQYKNILQNPKI